MSLLKAAGVVATVVAKKEEVEVFTPNPRELDGVDDLCKLQYLGEDNVLHNLKYRYNNGDISTATTTKVLIVVNPYEAVPGVDSKDTMERYRRLPMDMEGFMDSKQTGPNTFLIAHTAYSKLCVNEKNQSVKLIV
jgi:myosin heavy subunit